jgi:hypothetical protein
MCAKLVKQYSYTVEGGGNDQWLKTTHHYQLKGARYGVSNAEQRSGHCPQGTRRAPGLFQLRNV